MDPEHVTEMILSAGLLILGDVGEMCQIVGVLAGAVDVADVVLADGILRSVNDTMKIRSAERNGREDVGSAIARAVSPGDACSVGKRTPARAYNTHTLTHTTQYTHARRRTAEGLIIPD